MTPGRHAEDRPSPRPRLNQHRPITRDRDPMGRHSPLDVPLEDSELTTTGLWVEPPIARGIPTTGPGSAREDRIRTNDLGPTATVLRRNLRRRRAHWILQTLFLVALGALVLYGVYTAAIYAYRYSDDASLIRTSELSPLLVTVAALLIGVLMLLLVVWWTGPKP